MQVDLGKGGPPHVLVYQIEDQRGARILLDALGEVHLDKVVKIEELGEELKVNSVDHGVSGAREPLDNVIDTPLCLLLRERGIELLWLGGEPHLQGGSKLLPKKGVEAVDEGEDIRTVAIKVHCGFQAREGWEGDKKKNNVEWKRERSRIKSVYIASI